MTAPVQVIVFREDQRLLEPQAASAVPGMDISEAPNRICEGGVLRPASAEHGRQEGDEPQ
ncbi:hypothetical protein [Streptomyces clavuligerus]|uniref:hypothetical protein n=1 Tax=Streptomyces clavuligerus TaxID=1901 RepID=UPI001F07FD13|nr:hypothetical protein [Streptomyces clavuligerus]